MWNVAPTGEARGITRHLRLHMLLVYVWSRFTRVIHAHVQAKHAAEGGVPPAVRKAFELFDKDGSGSLDEFEVHGALLN